MIITLNESDRLTMFNAWSSGELDTDKLTGAELQSLNAKPLTPREAQKIIEDIERKCNT